MVALACGAVARAFAAELPRQVAIEVEQSYEYRKPTSATYQPMEGVDLPVRDLVEDILYAAGIKPLAPGEKGTADATIRVKVRGRALGANYFEPVQAFLYTGAQIKGSVTIEQAGVETISSTFTSQTQQPFHLTLNLGYDDPRNAPFKDTLLRAGGFIRELAADVARAWGPAAIVPSLKEDVPALRASVATLLGDLHDTAAVPALIDALKDDNDRVRWQAAWSLGKIGDRSAIPALIDALLDQSSDVRWFASWSLRTITGADIGPDHAAWVAWQQQHGATSGS